MAQDIELHAASELWTCDPTNPEWDGSTFKLDRFYAIPASGVDGAVEWFQTMECISFCYELEDSEQEYTQDEFLVEVSISQLRVSIGDTATSNKGKVVSAISGDFAGRVRRDDAWWTVRGEGDCKIFRFSVPKLDHQAWSSCWRSVLFRRQSFPWSDVQREAALVDKQKLEAIEPERRFQVVLPSTFSPEDLVKSVVDVEETEEYATVYIHFEPKLFEETMRCTSLENLLTASVQEARVQVFLKLAQDVQIFDAFTAGPVMPEETMWAANAMRPAAKSGYDPTLVITVLKQVGSQTLWGEPFVKCRFAEDLVTYAPELYVPGKSVVDRPGFLT